jgi:hypothetical protein
MAVYMMVMQPTVVSKFLCNGGMTYIWGVHPELPRSPREHWPKMHFGSKIGCIGVAELCRVDLGCPPLDHYLAERMALGIS